MEIDNFNICYIYKLKNQSANIEDIKNNLITEHGNISKKKLYDILNAQTDHDFIELIKTTKIGKGITQNDLLYIEAVFEKNTYKINKHYLRFSTNPNICVLTYINLCMNEINNIIHIVEGKRYNLTNDEIQKFIIGMND